MFKKFITILFCLLTLVLIACSTKAQQIDKITIKCPNPLPGYASILATGKGDLTYVPCPTKKSIFSGIVDFSGATVILPPIPGTVTGTGTTNFIPRWTNGAGSVLGNTPSSWDGTTYAWNNTALNANFLMSLTPSSAGAGAFTIGRTGGTVNYFQLNESAGVATIRTTGGVQINSVAPISIGDVSVLGNGTTISIDDASETILLWATSSNGLVSLMAGNTIDFNGGGSIGLSAPTITANSSLGTFQAGDSNNGGNGTKFTIDDSQKEISAHSSSGAFQAGDLDSTGNSTRLAVDDFGQRISMNTNAMDLGGAIMLGSAKFGRTNGSQRIYTEVDQTTHTFRYFDNYGAGTLDFASAILTFLYARTVTAGGVTGNQTINLPAGTVNLAAAATAITVTNSTVTANSIIMATARTNDATCSVKNVVAGAGSFVINMTAACTAETSVGFLVTN